jgi:A/G-specific adenine glycosylase
MPEKRVVWLVVLRGNEVLLERRPPSGVWGGLWSFPELPGGFVGPAQAKAHCRRVLGCEVSAVRKLAFVVHGFTHFRLLAQPVRCSVRRVRKGVCAPGCMWLALADAARAAVPAPVRALLRAIAQ